MAKKVRKDPLGSLVVSSRTNISIKLFEEIKGKIVSGELPAGYLFPNEIVFSEKLNVGRTTLREAFHALAAIGLIKRTKNGTFVEDRKNIASATPFSELLRQSEVNDFLEFRIMVEAEIAALAAVRATDEDIKTLEQCLVKMEENQDNIEELTRYDTQFHMRLGESSKNELFMKMVQVIQDIYKPLIFKMYKNDEEVIRRAQLFHSKIHAAIKSHNPLKAREASYKHLSNVMKTVTPEERAPSRR
jgi:GntR family transcriptional repressor for pyruvate dehydrogenase complex